MPFRRRFLGWLRTWFKLALLIFGYLWIGTAYKLVYAQTHDLTRFGSAQGISIPYYQQHFLIESLTRQTFLFGPSFKQFVGEPPNLAALFTENPIAALSDYARRREAQLVALPARFPRTVFAEEALQDAFFYNTIRSGLSILGTRDQPNSAIAIPEEGKWSVAALPDLQSAIEISRTIADDYPSSPQAPVALLNLASLLQRQGSRSQSFEVYRRLALEYPRTEQAEQAADALHQLALETGDVQAAREYKRRALQAAEVTGRRRARGGELPARAQLNILGFRIDLSSLTLRLGERREARTQVDVATRMVEGLRSVTGLDEGQQDELRRRRRNLDRVRSELWVADLYEALQVGLPGPPPRPDEYAVTGEVTLDGAPFAGVEVALEEAPRGLARNPQIARLRRLIGMVGRAQSNYPHRAAVDRRGRYVLEGVPAGHYRVRVIFPTQPADSGGVPVVPVEPAPDEQVTVDRSSVTLPPLRFARGIRTHSAGPLPATGGHVRIEWDPMPGAARYEVVVRPTPLFVQLFAGRKKPEEMEAFQADPVLWSASDLTGTRAELPLVPLAPDQPEAVYTAQYEYSVTAYDPGGRKLAMSSPVLTRFELDRPAQKALLALKPPRYGSRGFVGVRRRRVRPEMRNVPPPPGGNEAPDRPGTGRPTGDEGSPTAPAGEGTR